MYRERGKNKCFLREDYLYKNIKSHVSISKEITLIQCSTGAAGRKRSMQKIEVDVTFN